MLLTALIFIESVLSGRKSVQTLNSLRVFVMCWRRLYRVLDSCIGNTRLWPKIARSIFGQAFSVCENDFSFSLTTILSQSDESWHCPPGIWPWCSSYMVV